MAKFFGAFALQRACARNAPRQLSGRGLAFWQGSNGQTQDALCDSGYQLIALDALLETSFQNLAATWSI